MDLEFTEKRKIMKGEKEDVEVEADLTTEEEVSTKRTIHTKSNIIKNNK